MSYTVLQTITEALYESGIVARSFETPTGEQINDGLNFFNDVLDSKRIDEATLPYYVKYDFSAVQGQETYFIPDLIEVETFVFYLDQVRYAVSPMKRLNYFGSPRAENIQSLMTNWHIERTVGGSNLYLYFLPNEDYPCEIWGLFALDSVTLTTELSTGFDRYYINYLEYDLAIYLCQKFNVEVPQGLRARFIKYDRLIRKRSGVIDLQNRVISTLAGNSTLNYGQANFGKGWTTSNH